MHLIKQKLFVVSILWWLIFLVLSITQFNQFQILNIVGFSFLILVPGFLTISILGLEKLEFWAQTSLVVAISILEIMVVPLIGNTILPLFGILHPLTRSILLVEISLLFNCLLIINIVKTKVIKISTKRYILFNELHNLVFSFIPIIFVLLAVFGAIRLNNEGSGILTFIMLIGMGIYSAVLIYYSEKVEPNVIPISLFFISLALLLMTSLRGWFITGHDIQREFRVFELTKNNGIWSIFNFHDAYNACMSITILPTVFSNLLKIFDPYVYKIFFQIIFATVPGIIFLTVKRYFSTIIALISTFYFIAFPTFFTDMPFLNRQEIAFIFLMLMFYLIFDERLSLFKRRVIFTIFGLGMVLSHYSTTYTVVVMLIFLLISQPVVRFLGLKLKEKGWLSQSTVSEFNQNGVPTKSLITFWMVAVLIVSSFLWSSVLTDTASGSITRVISKTFSVIINNTKEEGKSGAVLSYSLLSWKKLDQEALFKEYKKDVVQVARAQAPAGTYFPDSLYSQYPLNIVSEGILPLTSLGKVLTSIGIDVVSVNSIIRLSSAKILQLLIVIGFCVILFTNKFFIKPLETEFILMACGGLLFIASLIVIPVLSVEYGVMRAFQQSLLFLSPFIVIGSLALVAKFSNRFQILFTSSLIIIFFLSTTGVFTQALGGYGSQLHLNNGGQYYDTFYLHATEMFGIQWLEQEVQKNPNNEYQSEVQTDRFAISKIDNLVQVNTLNDIYPGLIRKGSYIYLGFTNVNKSQANVSYNDTNIAYNFPVKFLDDNKNLVYSNGGVKIYK